MHSNVGTRKIKGPAVHMSYTPPYQGLSVFVLYTIASMKCNMHKHAKLLGECDGIENTLRLHLEAIYINISPFYLHKARFFTTLNSCLYR